MGEEAEAPTQPAEQEEPQAPPPAPQADPLEASGYSYEGQPGLGSTRKTKAVINGYVGAPPSSLAALATGKRYLADPLTPLTPRPNRDLIRTSTTGPPLATARSNHWVTQTSPAYLPVRLQNHRIPKTPIEVKVGFPARPLQAAGSMDNTPRYMVDAKGHLLPQHRKPGRAAFPEVAEVGPASWTFRKMGFV